MFHKYYITLSFNDDEFVKDFMSWLRKAPNNDDRYCVYSNIFDSNPHQGRSFSDALHALKNGKGARLPKWSPDVVIRAQFPDEHSKMTAPYLYVESRFGRAPWKETFIELFSEEWEIVD